MCRAAAVEQLAQLGRRAEAAIPQLVELLGDRSPAKTGRSTMELHYIVRNALIKMGPVVIDQVIAGLEHKNRQVRMDAAEVLGRLRAASAVRPLVKVLGAEDREVTMHASEALVLIGEAAIDPVIETLADQNAVARSGAANTLGSIQHRTVVRPLGRLLFDQDEKVRECAGYALYKLAQGDPGGTNSAPVG